MMASIPNMRSTPLPVPTAKGAPAGDATSTGFAVELPTVPGGPCVVAPPIQAPTPSDLLDGIAPEIATPEGGEDGKDGDGAAPVKAEKTPPDDVQPETAILLPFVQQLPTVPAPLAQTAATGGTSPAVKDAEPASLPGGAVGNGRKAAPTPDGVDAPLEETDTPDPATAKDAVIKALLQRKTSSAKQGVAKLDATVTSKTDAPPAKAQPQQAQAPAAPVAAPAAAPLSVVDMPQPAVSPNAAQPVPAAAEKTMTVDGTSTTDLSVERKLDLSRDSAWLDRLAHDIARAASDDSPLRFRLHPQTLGSLQVELQQGDRGTAVRLTVETETARQILTDAQPRLTAEARAQGVRIAETHVDLSGSGRHAPGDQRRQDEARQSPLIRTVPGTGPDAAATARSARRARLDRYA